MAVAGRRGSGGWPAAARLGCLPGQVSIWTSLIGTSLIGQAFPTGLLKE